MKYYLVIDFETSGLASEGAQPLDFAAVLLDKKTYQPIAEFQQFIRYDSNRFTWSPEAEETHGLTRDRLDAEGFSMQKAWSDFVDWIGRHIDLSKRGEVMFCGQNILFDLRFLQIMAEVEPTEDLLPPWACVTVRDTLQWAALINQASIDAFGFDNAPFWAKDTGYPSVSLENIAAGLGIDTGNAHSALDDARTTGKVMASLISHLSKDLANSRQFEAKHLPK